MKGIVTYYLLIGILLQFILKLKLQLEISLMSYIINSSDPDCLNPNKTGGKCSSLADLQLRHRVPEFFVLSDKLYLEVAKLAGLSKFYDRLETLKIWQTWSIDQISLQIREAFLSVKLPENIRQEIFEHAKNQSRYNSWRSSMVGEDGVKLSYAGVLRTELFVSLNTPEDVDKILLPLLADGYSVGAIKYRIQHGVSQKIVLPVGIQKQINSYAGVVLFGQSFTSDKRSVLSVVYGQCEAVVANKVQVFRYEVDNSNFKVEILSGGPQTKQLLPNYDTKSVEWIDIQPEYQTLPPIPENILQEITRIGQEEYQHTGIRRDMEFSITINPDTKDFIIWSLQSRPVTKQIVTKLGEKDTTTPILATGIPCAPGVVYCQVVKPGSKPKHLPENVAFVGSEFEPDNDWTLGSIVGIVADTGNESSHGVAKGNEFKIPTVLAAVSENGTPFSQLVNEGDWITIDGFYGIIYKGKSQSRLDWFNSKPAQQTINTDGLNTNIYVNCSFPENAQEAFEMGADGVGLLRGDFLWDQFPLSYMVNGTENVATNKVVNQLIQTAKPFYDMFVNSNGQKGKVVYRTFGPKLHEMRVKNGSEPWHNSLLKDHRDPSAGIQGLALSLHPDYLPAFIMELKIFKQAWEQYPNLSLMFPVVRSIDDCEELMDVLTYCGLNNPNNRPIRWMMAELGINFTQPESFLRYFDGASIGFNDSDLSLRQKNRGEMTGSYRYPIDSPELVKTYCDYARVARSLGKTVSGCGNLPTISPKVCKQFVQAGFTSISVGVQALPEIETFVRNTESNKPN
jgi:pyruvate, water dikinase